MEQEERLSGVEDVIAFDHLNLESDARMALQRILDKTMMNVMQWTHRVEKSGEYRVRHVEEGCQLCDDINKIHEALCTYRDLVQGRIDERTQDDL